MILTSFPLKHSSLSIERVNWLPLQWRHNERYGVSNHRRLDYLLNCLFRRRSTKTSKLHATGLCEGNTPVIGGFPSHSGETDEANYSWLHPVWPPPKRPDQDSTFCVVSSASTELIFCIHRDFDVRNNVCKPRRLVCECCRYISAWKSRVMKPTVLGDEANCWGAFT